MCEMFDKVSISETDFGCPESTLPVSDHPDIIVLEDDTTAVSIPDG